MLKSHQRRFAVPSKTGVFRSRWRDQKNSEQPLDGQKAKLDFGWVPLFTLCVTIFTAIAFGAGKNYRAQYLRSFGFTDAVIPWSFQDVVYLGITKQADVLVITLFASIGVVLGFFVLSSALHWWNDKLVAQRAKKSRSSKQIKTNSSMNYLAYFCQFLVLCIGFVFIGGIYAMFLSLFAGQRGGDHAEAAKESVAQGSKVEPKMPYVIIERKVGAQKIVEAGYLFICSERVCGLYSPAPDKKKGTSRLVPMDGITSFRSGD